MDEISESVNPEKQALGRRLKGLRENFSWTLSEISQATKQIDPEKEGVSKVSISRYENGDSFPGYREIKLLSQAFGVSITFLFYGDVPDPYSGWEFSLDEYLRSVIKDVLIEEGVVEGESRADREHKKTLALRLVNGRRKTFDPNQMDEEDLIEKEKIRERKWKDLGEMADKVDQGNKKRPPKSK
ncbi:MAG: helix-turn-helix transcriptional regulator [Rhodoferax sp.]|nr:helix-turn-helix transcriptional regulator [Rhodoferax sp.]MDP3651811.1 helix-turn-helix transcriptional regulator [Rhodoferax sp.]